MPFANGIGMRRMAPVAGVALLLVANGAVLWSFRLALTEQRRALGELTSAVAALGRTSPTGPAAQTPRMPNGSPMFCSDRVDALASVIADRLKGSASAPLDADARAPGAQDPPDDAPATPQDARAFDEVARLIDDAIRTGTLSRETALKIRQLKASAHRPQDFAELNLRIAAAINRGELSLPKGDVALP